MKSELVGLIQFPKAFSHLGPTVEHTIIASISVSVSGARGIIFSILCEVRVTPGGAGIFRAIDGLIWFCAGFCKWSGTIRVGGMC